EFQYLRNNHLLLSPHFPDSYTPILTSNQNLLYHNNIILQLSPQFFLQPNLHIQYLITLIPFPSLQHTKHLITLTNHHLKQPFEFIPTPYHPNISIV
ncbi:accessory Sec system protein Asp2, partial [Staphylococcus capitis]|uniref:accessory Sec system protein Asp2 n=1 Tax=Staphylococcus capitis TaxID=29388 RepID=UPI003709A418